jgi:hypothetical protein
MKIKRTEIIDIILIAGLAPFGGTILHQAIMLATRLIPLAEKWQYALSNPYFACMITSSILYTYFTKYRSPSPMQLPKIRL